MNDEQEKYFQILNNEQEKYCNEIINIIKSSTLKDFNYNSNEFVQNNSFKETNEDLNIFDNEFIKMWNIEIQIYNNIINENQKLLPDITNNNFTVNVFTEYTNELRKYRINYKQQLLIKFIQAFNVGELQSTLIQAYKAMLINNQNQVITALNNYIQQKNQSQNNRLMYGGGHSIEEIQNSLEIIYTILDGHSKMEIYNALSILIESNIIKPTDQNQLLSLLEFYGDNYRFR